MGEHGGHGHAKPSGGGGGKGGNLIESFSQAMADMVEETAGVGKEVVVDTPQDLLEPGKKGGTVH